MPQRQTHKANGRHVSNVIVHYKNTEAANPRQQVGGFCI